MALVEHAVEPLGLPKGVEDEGGMSMPVMGTVLFIASEVMFFFTFFGAYFALRAVAGPGNWPPKDIPPLDMTLPLILTGVLLTSSLAVHGAVWGVRNNNRTVFVAGLAITVLLGSLFLMGEIYDATSLGFDFSTNAYGSIFFTILSFHGLHVAGGVIFLMYCLFGALGGKFSHENYQVVESGSMYWHFVDVIWILVFLILYVAK